MTDDTYPRPIPESYWVEPGRLLAGEYPGKFDQEVTRQRLDAFFEAGFDTFIDLTQSGEMVEYLPILHEEAKLYGVEVHHQRFAIGDFGLPTPTVMKSILDTIDENLRTGRRIYLHCWGGIGRTGTTVGCYLVRRSFGGKDALRQLADWWQSVPKSHLHPHSPETLEQMNFILSWVDFENDPPK